MAVSDLLERMSIGEDADGIEDADLVDDGEPVAPDPKPNRGAKASNAKTPAPKITAATRKEVKDKLSMVVGVPAAMWAGRDPYCAGVLSAQQDEIVDRLTAVAVRNRRMLAWLTSTGEYTDWIMLATAVWPVAAAWWSHHVARSVSEEAGYGHPAGNPPLADADGWPPAAAGAGAWNGYPA